MQELPSEHVAIVGAIDPDANAAGSPATGWIPVKDYHSFMAILQTGILGTAATLIAKLEQADSAAGANAKDITGKTTVVVTETSASPPDTNDKQHIINLKQEELDIEGGFFWFRMISTVAVATSDYSGLVLGLGSRYGPATENDAATVVQIIN